MEQLVRVRIEVPRGGFVKRDHRGRLELVSPLPCPFNYGSVVDSLAPDGDPLDAVVLGPALLPGDEVTVRVRGRARFVDAGAQDDKLICSHNAVSVEEEAVVRRFFAVYARVKRTANTLRRRQGKTTFDGLTLQPTG